MNKKYGVLSKISKAGVVAVLRSETEEKALKVASSCVIGGVKNIEVTFSVPNADKVIASLKKQPGLEDAVIGAGTVLDEVSARLAILAGAEFVVAPTFDKNVAMMCNQYGVPYIPGCMTVNEIYEAMKYGVDVVKLFPANQFTPAIIKAIKAPIPQIDIMVTGGVNMQNTAEWIAAGACSVGVGGNLTTVKNDDYEAIEQTAADYLAQVRIGRNGDK